MQRCWVPLRALELGACVAFGMPDRGGWALFAFSREWRLKRSKGSQASMMTNLVVNKPRDKVDDAAVKVHQFYSAPDNELRRFASAVSDGAIFFVGSVWSRAANGAIKFRREEGTSVAGLTQEVWQSCARARLCDPDP